MDFEQGFVSRVTEYYVGVVQGLHKLRFVRDMQEISDVSDLGLRYL